MRMEERKVRGGKLVRIKVEDREGKIAGIRIEGDFFVHPEEGLKAMESSLIGADPGDPEDMRRRLGAVVMELDLQLVGFSVDDIIALIGGT